MGKDSGRPCRVQDHTTYAIAATRGQRPSERAIQARSTALSTNTTDEDLVIARVRETRAHASPRST
jgi:hypothetical protein